MNFSSDTNMATFDWNATQYLKFGDERIRPVRDLLSQVPLESPQYIVDLGCGPGSSTAVLAARYAHSNLEGMDSSPDMIKKARATLPDIKFKIQDLHHFEPKQAVDLFFSNAVFQWLPDRLQVIQKLILSQQPGGVFAFQIPDTQHEPVYLALQQTAEEGPWAETLSRRQNVLRDVIEPPQVLYDQLEPLCSSVNIWHTIYYHVLESHEAIIEWVTGTGLRPYIEPLPENARAEFIKRYLERLKQGYPVSNDGKVLLRFPRLFMVAVRA